MEKDPRKKADAFFDREGKLLRYPSKRSLRVFVLERVGTAFEEGRDYTEKEVNAIIRERFAFSDVELIRRELFEAHMLGRLPDGSKYWKNKAE